MRRRSRRTEGQRRCRGAALTEAALISPLFFALIFGVVEMGVLFRDHLTVSNTTRDGARQAAAVGNDVDADWRILQTIKQSSAAASRNDIQRIIVFKASAPSDPVPSTCTGTAAPGGVAGVCNVYVLSDLNRPSSDFNCGVTGPDKYLCPVSVSNRDTRLVTLGYIGVYVELKHRYVTGFFGQTVDIRDTVVVRIEPRTTT